MVSGEEHPEERTPEERTARPKGVDELREHAGGWGEGWGGSGPDQAARVAPEGLWPHAG